MSEGAGQAPGLTGYEASHFEGKKNELCVANSQALIKGREPEPLLKALDELSGSRPRFPLCEPLSQAEHQLRQEAGW